MGTTATDWKSVASNALKLPDEKLAAILKLLEGVSGNPGVPDAIAILRPRLALLQPPRPMTAMRLAFWPAEDLFDDIDNYRRGISRISRGILPRCWEIMVNGVGGARITALQGQLSGLTTMDRDALVEQGDWLWNDASLALRRALWDSESNPKTRVALFGRDDDVLKQVGVLAEVIGSGKVVQFLKDKVPGRPVAALNEEQSEEVKKAVAAVAERGGAAVTAFLLVFAARMTSPGDILDVFTQTRSKLRSEDQASVARDTGAGVVEAVLASAARFAEQQAPRLSLTELVQGGERVARGLRSLRPILARVDFSAMQKRAETAQQAVAGVLRGPLLDGAADGLLALFGPYRGTEPPASPPGQGCTASAVKVAETEDFTRLLRRFLRFAPGIGLHKEARERTADIVSQARRIGQNLGAAYGSGDAAVQAGARNDMLFLLRIVETVAGAEERQALQEMWGEDAHRLELADA